MTDDCRQISAFAAAKVSGKVTACAYSVYDNGKRQVIRSAAIPGISEHRALLMAVWSAVRYCKEYLPEYLMSLYCAERRVPDELTKVWYNEAKPSDFEDGDRIESIITDCCHIAQTAFSVVKPDDTEPSAEYARRMRELIKLIGK